MLRYCIPSFHRMSKEKSQLQTNSDSDFFNEISGEFMFFSAKKHKNKL